MPFVFVRKKKDVHGNDSQVVSEVKAMKTTWFSLVSHIYDLQMCKVKKM